MTNSICTENARRAPVNAVEQNQPINPSIRMNNTTAASIAGAAAAAATAAVFAAMGSWEASTRQITTREVTPIERRSDKNGVYFDSIEKAVYDEGAGSDVDKESLYQDDYKNAGTVMYRLTDKTPTESKVCSPSIMEDWSTRRLSSAAVGSLGNGMSERGATPEVQTVASPDARSENRFIKKATTVESAKSDCPLGEAKTVESAKSLSKCSASIPDDDMLHANPLHDSFVQAKSLY